MQRMNVQTRPASFAALLLLSLPAAARELPAGFVYLRDVDPTIAQEMRYAGLDNFTGRSLPGYGAGECILKRAVAEALAKVQADLATQKLGLKVYDCYRPLRAVAAMRRWAWQSEDGATKRFYPALDKRALFADGYIAAHSRHSTGTAVDLTLIPLDASATVRSRESGNPGSQTEASPVAPGSPRARGRTDSESTSPALARANKVPCTAPAEKRAPDTSLDMGTGFDCLDPKSSAFASNITAAQNHGRVLLLAAMRKRGFRNYFREWWHFSLGLRGESYDFPIAPRAN